MRNKKKFQIGFDDVLVVMILLFTLAFMVYLGWKAALLLTAFVGVFGPIMSTLGSRRDSGRSSSQKLVGLELGLDCLADFAFRKLARLGDPTWALGAPPFGLAAARAPNAGAPLGVGAPHCELTSPFVYSPSWTYDLAVCEN